MRQLPSRGRRTGKGLGISGETDVPAASKYPSSPFGFALPLTVPRSPQQITERLDNVIAAIREKYHSKSIGKARKDAPPGDVLLVAHGHILRAFAGRWVNKNIADNPSLILEAGGVGTLRYVGLICHWLVCKLTLRW